jgi:putative glutamine amidotransferase
MGRDGAFHGERGLPRDASRQAGGMGFAPEREVRMMSLRIGLSYRDNSGSNKNYERALRAAAERAGIAMELFWLAAPGQPLDMALAETIDGTVLTGGADLDPAVYKAAVAGAHEPDPERDHAEERLLEAVSHFWEAPILAICRGHQVLNALTSKEPDALIQNLQTKLTHTAAGGTDARHEVRTRPDSMLAGLIGAVAEVNSSHHQAVDRLADPFVVTATAPDGTIEAYEWADPADRPWLLAVQWHPERLAGPAGDGILDAFLAAAKAAR